uniref:S1 motif domain-containing protein n=1 Tax=Lactuca sativa TaxID=4236 RepID=A0A9R1VFC7_LACSA|nr:hypothetical protein LSAT_V11C500277060 [Lactuca sativa]
MHCEPVHHARSVRLRRRKEVGFTLKKDQVVSVQDMIQWFHFEMGEKLQRRKSCLCESLWIPTLGGPCYWCFKGSLSLFFTICNPSHVIGGRVSKILPSFSGLIVQIDPHLSGKVHFTEFQDPWVPNPLSGYHEGQFVKCKVVEIGHSGTGAVHVDLFLCSFVNPQSNRYEKIEDLHPNRTIEGYVKNVTPKGCFIMLSRKLHAKILISNLSDDFVSKPEQEFPIGKLVSGSLNVGEIISGRVKRIDSFGLSIEIDQSKLVDEERQRISLGMKGSYFDNQTQEIHNSDSNLDSESDNLILTATPESLIPFSNGNHPALAEMESRASVLPLEATLDEEADESPMEEEQAQIPEPLDDKKT